MLAISPPFLAMPARGMGTGLGKTGLPIRDQPGRSEFPIFANVVSRSVWYALQCLCGSILQEQDTCTMVKIETAQMS